jgi:hypothetical protein
MNKSRAVLESEIEAYLVARVEALGGACEKTVSPSSRGYFDRVVVLPPSGRVVFCETKKPRGSHTTAHQKKRHELYRALGAEVAVLKTFADVDKLLAKEFGRCGAGGTG